MVLNVSASDPDGGTTFTYAWSVRSKHKIILNATASTSSLKVENLEPGVYIFTVSVTEWQNEKDTDEVMVMYDLPSNLQKKFTSITGAATSSSVFIGTDIFF